MKKILILTEEQYKAVINVVNDAVRSVVNDYSQARIDEANDDDQFFYFSGTEMPSEHRALESIDWKDQTSDQDDAQDVAPTRDYSDLYNLIVDQYKADEGYDGIYFSDADAHVWNNAPEVFVDGNKKAYRITEVIIDHNIGDGPIEVIFGPVDDEFYYSTLEDLSAEKQQEIIDWCFANFDHRHAENVVTLDDARENVRKARDAYKEAEHVLECKMAQEIQGWAKDHPNVTPSLNYISDGNTLRYLGENVAGWDVVRMSEVLDILKSYKPQWTTILSFPKYREIEDDHNNMKPLFDSFEEAMIIAQEMAEQYAIDVIHASVQDGATCHIHVHQYATPECSENNAVEVYNDPDPDCTRYDYRVEVKQV